MPSFDAHNNIRSLGQELVLAYESAAQGTTPGLKGDAREKAVRTKLEAILPGGVGVGTGCVIDSEGKASSQIDVILYEQQFCPIFRVAEDVGYYPCESVIAVGEIKSTIGKKELGDIYQKVASVRKLNRFTKPVGLKEPPAGKVAYRTYLGQDHPIYGWQPGYDSKLTIGGADLRIRGRAIIRSRAGDDDQAHHRPVRRNTRSIPAQRGSDARSKGDSTRSWYANVIYCLGKPRRDVPNSRQFP